MLRRLLKKIMNKLSNQLKQNNMKYIRVKLSEGDITSSQIMTENEFKEWIQTRDFWKGASMGIRYSFSAVIKSPLLKGKSK